MPRRLPVTADTLALAAELMALFRGVQGWTRGATAAAVRAAFPKGNLSVDLRAEFGTLYHDQLFAGLYPPEGRPVEVAPWRLALVVVMQDHRRAHRSPGGRIRPPLHGLEICLKSRPR